MRIFGTSTAFVILLTACGRPDIAGDDQQAAGKDVQQESGTTSVVRERASGRWDLQSSGEGVTLLYSTSGSVAVRLICRSDGNNLLVNVPAFRPVASEERMSFGGDGEVVTLVADTRGDRQRGGVTASGAVPPDLLALVSGPVAVNYGYQNSGPHMAPPTALVRAFVAACGESSTPPPNQPPPVEKVSACLVQDSERLSNPALRAVGTEPFWSAQIEGRCVTYSHPENPEGTRVWTRFASAPQGGGIWSGMVGRERFQLKIRPSPGCSDGMSDKRYPYAAELTLNGELRKGCAQLR